MNLNNIELSPSLLTDLYAHSLVEGTPLVTKVKEPAKSTGKKYLGDNARKVVVAAAYPGVVYLPDETLSYLTTILTACKLTLADVAILNLHEVPAEEAAQQIQELQPEVLLLFGIDPAEAGLPVRFPLFQKQKVNGVTCLCAPVLEEIKENRDTKGRELWNHLRSVFNL